MLSTESDYHEHLLRGTRIAAFGIGLGLIKVLEGCDQGVGEEVGLLGVSCFLLIGPPSGLLRKLQHRQWGALRGFIAHILDKFPSICFHSLRRIKILV